MQSCLTIRICEDQFHGDTDPSERLNEFSELWLCKLRHAVFCRMKR